MKDSTIKIPIIYTKQADKTAKAAIRIWVMKEYETISYTT